MAGADSLETSLLFDVFAASEAVGRFLDSAMEGGPLTPAAYAVYSAMFELEAATPTELAGRLGMRLTTCMDQLRAIERRGHAGRMPHSTDRRSYRVVLTAAGLDAHRRANRRFEAAHRALTAALPDGEARVRRGLQDLREAVETADLSRRPSVGRAG